MTTVAIIRRTILRCAEEAAQAEPRSVEFRLHSFAAKLSGSFGCMNEHDLDAAVWGLLETTPQPSQPSAAGA